jgi:hypothetical protein
VSAKANNQMLPTPLVFACFIQLMKNAQNGTPEFRVLLQLRPDTLFSRQQAGKLEMKRSNFLTAPPVKLH